VVFFGGGFFPANQKLIIAMKSVRKLAPKKATFFGHVNQVYMTQETRKYIFFFLLTDMGDQNS